MTDMVILAVAALHLSFLVSKCLYGTTPFDRTTIGKLPESAARTATLAANQGLYNDFIAAGPTAERSIPFLQALPAVPLSLVHLVR